MSELQYNLIAMAGVTALLVVNRRAMNRRAIQQRITRALSMWLHFGDFYFIWTESR